MALLWPLLVSASPAMAAPPAAPVQELLVDAYSLSQVADTARRLRRGGRLHLEGISLDPSEPAVGLDLERFEVFAGDGRVVVHGADGATEEHPFPAHRYLRGRVIGEPGSLAVLSVLEDGQVRGIVRREGGLFEVGRGPLRPDGSRGLAGRRAEALPGLADRGFECDADRLTPPPEAAESLAAKAGTLESAPQAATTTPYTARVAVETDWELYHNRFGDNQAALEAYIGDLFAYSSSIYDSEINTNLVVSHLSIWATPADPYGFTGSCGLYELGRYWNDNRAGVSRTIAHLVSGKSSSVGVAWLGVLCQGPFNVNLNGSCAGLSPQIDNYGGAYGISSGITGSFNPAHPAPVWDLVVVSHEIGHNFNSEHTHCYNGLGGSSLPVDQCYNGEAAFGCYSGAVSLPGPAGAGSGTLMSYCHLLSPGLSNIGLTFGAGHPYGVLPQRVPDRMRAHVEARASIAAACLARIDPGPCDNLDLSNQTVTTTELFEACGTLTAGSGFVVANTGDVTLRAGTVALTSGFSVEGGASLRIENP